MRYRSPSENSVLNYLNLPVRLRIPVDPLCQECLEVLEALRFPALPCPPSHQGGRLPLVDPRGRASLEVRGPLLQLRTPVVLDSRLLLVLPSVPALLLVQVLLGDPGDKDYNYVTSKFYQLIKCYIVHIFLYYIR